ncbi:hypothetical protein Q8A73_006494 [Channa argus]|nr:hypothetical protein Q8A73_006494 [Channa argus]
MFQESSPSMYSVIHQHAHRHAFTPFLHRPSTIPPPPAVMAAQGPNFSAHLPRGTSFPPITAFTTHTSFGGRWSSLHVCIAWKIYYHKQMKKMQQTFTSFREELTPEYPSGTSLRESEQPKESDPLSCIPPNLVPRLNCTTTQREKTEPPTILHWKPDEREKRGVHKGYRRPLTLEAERFYTHIMTNVTSTPAEDNSIILTSSQHHACAPETKGRLF